MAKPTTIDQYIATFPADIRELLQLFRHTIIDACPQAVETISYGIPAFKFEGAMLAWFGAHTLTSGSIRVVRPLRLFRRSFRCIRVQKVRYNFHSINHYRLS